MVTTEGKHVEISHPQLGSVKGLVPIAGVYQFRSLPYASIPHRFADPVLVDSLGVEGTYDATEFGPIAPQPDDAEEQEFPSPKEQPPHEPLEMDEFRCCNLNVSVPTDVGKGLPVMVWFHGGSFMLGAASWPQYGIYLIERSNIRRFCQIRKVVCGKRTTRYWCWSQVYSPWTWAYCSYRLGIIGFLASKEIQEISPGNYGLKDQIASLDWVQKYIAGFGGDPNRVTIFGESVGGGYPPYTPNSN